MTDPHRLGQWDAGLGATVRAARAEGGEGTKTFCRQPAQCCDGKAKNALGLGVSWLCTPCFGVEHPVTEFPFCLSRFKKRGHHKGIEEGKGGGKHHTRDSPVEAEHHGEFRIRTPECGSQKFPSRRAGSPQPKAKSPSDPSVAFVPPDKHIQPTLRAALPPFWTQWRM